ncbi:MAG: hypothetical protein ACI8Y4_001149 [Candidatus Poriferisodalaceae bacterium]
MYPPSHHVLRHLRLTHTWTDSEMLTTMPVLDDLCDESGWLRLGVVATLVDSAAGSFSVREVSPDWVATLSLGTVLSRRAIGDHVTATCRPIRVGRNNITTETLVADDVGQVAASICTYTRLPGRADNPSVTGLASGSLDYSEADEEPRMPLDQYLRLTLDPERPIITLDHHPRIHNSFGSIQGGAAVMMIDEAACHAMRLIWQKPVRCVDAQVGYLAQAKGGPFRIEASVLRDEKTSATVRVQIVDTGNNDRLLDVASATVVPA